MRRFPFINSLSRRHRPTAGGNSRAISRPQGPHATFLVVSSSTFYSVRVPPPQNALIFGFPWSAVLQLERHVRARSQQPVRSLAAEFAASAACGYRRPGWRRRTASRHRLAAVSPGAGQQFRGAVPPGPPTGLLSASFFRDTSLERRIPRRAIFAAALWHVAFVVLPFPQIAGPKRNHGFDNAEVTWS